LFREAPRRSRGTVGLPRELVDAVAAALVAAGTTDAAIVTVVDPLASWVYERTTLFWVRTNARVRPTRDLFSVPQTQTP